MPRSRALSQQSFDTGLLEPEALTTRGGLQAALRSIESICYRDDPSTMEMIVELNNRPHVLEYILSTLDDQPFERLSRWIVVQFPTSYTPNVMETFGIKLLQRLSSSLMPVEKVVTAERRSESRESLRKVDLALDILEELGKCADRAPVDVNVSPTSRKKPKALTRHLKLDPCPFDSMGIAVPTTDHEVRVAYDDILLRLQGILGDYIRFLRQPKVSGVFKRQVEESRIIAAESTIKPIKASLYFDKVEGFGEWQILLSTGARKYLREARRGKGVMYEIIVKKMKELSQGHFSGDNQEKITGPETSIPVYEAKMTGDVRLVYRIDCIPNGEGETQAISIFGIYQHTQMDRRDFWETLSRQLENKGPEYVARCTIKEEALDTGENVILPASFPQLPVQEIQESAPPVSAREEDLKNIHSMLVLEKFVILSQALLNSILADRDVAHVFAVSALEQEIIENTSSCYVIGRSGTGKTTTMLFKMVGIERTWKQYPDMWDKPRQIFVTQSRILATKVEEYFLKLMLSVEAASYTPEELREMSTNFEKEMEYIDLDDMEQWRSDLPTKFSELSDGNFPLFITYERLCFMLQNDIGEENDNDGFIIPVTPVTPGHGGSPISPLSSRRTRHRGFSTSVPTREHSERDDRFISYQDFRSRYWNRFPQSITRGLDRALVFGEILGVIKGSERAIGTQQRCLDQDTYSSSGRQGMSSHTKDTVYDLFTAYTKLKRERQEYDAADRAHHILGEFRDVRWNEKEKGKKVDFLYIDEVQDNLLIDTLVLRTLCNNPHGLFWAGDTAQTISIGSSFKFSDLKSFQYRTERELHHGGQPADPKTYELVVNYRSHGGIVNCARSVVELITLYWSHSIDTLQPERASVDGPRPIFFSSQGNRDFEKSFFGDGKGEPVEFGHDQCILVRDNDAKKRLKERLGEESIIMTLYESKGLEFNDVLLYNFFQDSTVDASQWRLVIRGCPGMHDTPAPDFDETKHAGICTELKFLYVAITRARNNLWFLDNSESAQPMKVYWDSMKPKQIEIWESASEVPPLATISSSQDWVDTGNLMFTNKRYEQALVAFHRAGRTREVAICRAFLLRENARGIPDDQVKERADAFSEAGEAFSTCARESLPDRERERLAYYSNAAECFSQGGRLKEAGDCFVRVEKYSKAARAYREGGHFDEMVEVLEGHGDQIEHGLLARLKKVAQTNYFKHGKVQKAQKLFSSKEEAITFAEDYGFDNARVELLRTSGRILESAKVLRNASKIADAVKTLINPPMTQECAQLAVEYLKSGLWECQSFGMDHLTTDPEVVSELLELANALESDTDEDEAREIKMFRARHEGDFKTLHFLHPQFIQAGDYAAALLCLDPTFISTLPLHGATTMDHGPELSLHFAYFELLDRLRRGDRLDPGSMRQKIFAFRPREDDRFFVPTDSYLYKVFTSGSETLRGEEGYVVTHEELRRTLDREIPEYIHLRAKEQQNVYRRRLRFDPCMAMATRGECSGRDCKSQHIRPDQMTVSWFNARIRSVLMEIQILNLAGFRFKGIFTQWVSILYSILHPPSPKLGSIATLDLGNIPESTEGIRILLEWIWQACDELMFSARAPPFQYIETFIPDFMPVCTMAYDFDFQRAQDYVPRTRMHRFNKWPSCLTRPGSTTGGHFIVRDFALFLHGGPHHSLILGVLYLGQILAERIPANLGPVCDLVERLCGLHILAHRLTKTRGALHDVTLPSSWLIALLRSRPSLDKNVSYIRHFVNDMIELLRRIDLERENYNPQIIDQFKHNGFKLNPLYGSVYIARICFCLCLLGYNLNDNGLKDKVLQAIHGLRRPERVHGVHRQYVEADDWWGLVLVFTRSLYDSAFDEMIHLLHSKAPRFQGWVSRYVRQVVYENIGEIPDRLRAKAAGRPDARARADPSSGFSNPERRPRGPENDGSQQKQPVLPEEVVLNPKDGEHPVDNNSQHEVSASPEEIQAVLVIETAYHRISTRRKEVLKGICATRARRWSMLHERVSSMEWSRHSKYKLLMQGPLVHVLVCLDGVKIFADYINKYSKKQLRGDDHKRLEELIDRSDRSSDLQKAAAELQMKLGHLSPFHDKRDVLALKAAVLEAGRLIDWVSEFPGKAATKTKEQIKEDWKLGWDGIVKESVKGRKAQRPKLTLDEEDLLHL